MDTRPDQGVGTGLVDPRLDLAERSGTALGELAAAKTVLLRTFRRDGRPVDTPVHVVCHDGRLFIRTFDPSGKLKRIRRDPMVLVAPCTTRGRVLGPTFGLRARILDGSEAEAVARLLAEKYPLVHGVLVPFFHRLRGFKTAHLELVSG